jgi:hypothetical protein
MPAPLGPIVAGAARIIGKKVASKAATKAAAKKTAQKAAVKTAKKVEKAKKVSAKKDAAASARGLKAAQGPSKAPKGYVSDAARRQALKELNQIRRNPVSGLRPGEDYSTKVQGLKKILNSPEPKNIVSKFGKKSKPAK